MEEYFSYNAEAGIYHFLDEPIVKEIKKLELKEVKKIETDLDYVALVELGDESLWWVIAIYNDILDPFDVNKEYIKIPTKDSVLELLTSKRLK